MVDEDREEREYQAALHRLKILERKVKLGVGSVLVLVPFTWVFVAAILKGLEFEVADLPWQFIIPCVICGITVVLQLDLKDVLVYFGNFGAALARAGDKAKKAVEDEA